MCDPIATPQDADLQSALLSARTVATRQHLLPFPPPPHFGRLARRNRRRLMGMVAGAHIPTTLTAAVAVATVMIATLREAVFLLAEVPVAVAVAVAVVAAAVVVAAVAAVAGTELKDHAMA